MTVSVQGIAELKALAGRALGHTDWVQIEQSRVDTFADATDDHQWIHVDPERAAAGPFGGGGWSTAAHGHVPIEVFREEWVYNFGASRFMKVVTLDDGVATEVENGGHGFNRH